MSTQIPDSAMEAAASAIQTALEDDTTTTGHVAFAEYFGERAAAAALPVICAQIADEIEQRATAALRPDAPSWPGVRFALHVLRERTIPESPVSAFARQRADTGLNARSGQEDFPEPLPAAGSHVTE